MDDDIREMARRCYGYGRWDAPHWFIGPEPGQALDENNDLKPRAAAYRDLGKDGLSDCRDFHDRIDETRWHRERPRLQPTWRRLILLLMTFLDQPWDKDSIRNYQRDEWGRLNSETCVIELSGLPANSFTVRRDRELFRLERIGGLRQKMCSHKPRLVVMYGLRQKKYWEQIAGGGFGSDSIQSLESTIIALTRHPNMFGLKDVYWEDLGERLRHVAQKSLTQLSSPLPGSENPSSQPLATD
jgi:hypothetical protein